MRVELSELRYGLVIQSTPSLSGESVKVMLVRHHVLQGAAPRDGLSRAGPRAECAVGGREIGLTAPDERIIVVIDGLEVGRNAIYGRI